METYQVPAFYIAIQAVLSLYVTGKTTGKFNAIILHLNVTMLTYARH